MSIDISNFFDVNSDCIELIYPMTYSIEKNHWSMARQMIRMNMINICERGSNMKRKIKKDREIRCHSSNCVGCTGIFFVPPVNATMNNILKMFANAGILLWYGSLLNRMAPMQRWCPSC